MVSSPLTSRTSEPLRTDQCVDEVAEQGDAEDGGDKVFDHAASQRLPVASPACVDAALTAVDAILTARP